MVDDAANPGKPESHIRTHVKAGYAAIISGNRLDISFGTRVLEVNGDSVKIENTVPFTMISEFTNSSAFTLQVDLLRIFADTVTSDGKNFIFHAMKVESISETRIEERFSFSPEENVRCEFLNPDDEETVLVKPVLDMSASGFSLRTHANSALLKPGRHLTGMRIKIGDKLYAERNAQTVYQRRYMDETGKMHQQVGLKFTTAGANDKTK